MKCDNPVFINGVVASCYRCDPCLMRRKSIWATRIMLERDEHIDSAFITLTYSPDKLPLDGTLVPKDLQDWLKRIRKRMEPRKLRFYATGEYGETFGRPHYHIILFGYPPCNRRDRTTHVVRYKQCECGICDRIRETWGSGIVDVGSVTPYSAQYVAGYVTTKYKIAARAVREGIEPPFSRMSLRPGIGSGYAVDAAETFLHFNLDNHQADVPSVLVEGKKIKPLGRYIHHLTRKHAGMDTDEVRDYAYKQAKEEMRELQKIAEENSCSLREAYFKKNGQKIASWKEKLKIYAQRKEKSYEAS